METESLFRLITGIVLGTGMTIAATFRIRARLARGPVSRSEEGIWILLGLRIPSLICGAGMIAYFVQPSWLEWSSVPLSEQARWCGVALTVVAMTGVVWTFWHLGLNITDTVATTEAQTLVTSGPYGWVRHPLYCITAPFFLGISMVTSSAFFAAFYMVAMVFLVLRTRIEEEKLVAKFGDAYRDYMRRTGRFFPHRLLLR